MHKSFTFIDLFCGIGGFHQALSQLGGTCVFASDIDKECRKVYKENYGIDPVGDITAVDAHAVPDHDMLVGGFPCQAYSNAGHKLVFEDKRGRLFDEIVRIAQLKQPKFLLLENVKHIKKVDGGKMYQYIYEKLTEIGYSVQDVELSPHQFGIPQLRPRVFFICTRNDLPFIKYDFIPVPTIHSIFEEKVDCKYNVPDELCQVIDALNEILGKMEVGQKISVPILLDEFFKEYASMDGIADWKQTYIRKNKELYAKYKVYWDAWYAEHKELLSKKIVYSKLEWQTGELKKTNSIWDFFIQIRQSGIRVKRNDNFPTLVAIVQVPIYGRQKRYLTPRECARLQSFPDNFKLPDNDKIAYKQFGNSVNVEIVKFIIKIIIC